jgi:hypothetical protein
MDLHKELRLMIYERLPRQVVHTRIDFPAHDLDPKPTLILITRTCSNAILRVSRTIHDESKDIVREVAKEWIMPHPARIIGSYCFALEVLGDFLVATRERQDSLLDDDDGISLYAEVAAGKLHHDF